MRATSNALKQRVAGCPGPKPSSTATSPACNRNAAAGCRWHHNRLLLSDCMQPLQYFLLAATDSSLPAGSELWGADSNHLVQRIHTLCGTGWLQRRHYRLGSRLRPCRSIQHQRRSSRGHGGGQLHHSHGDCRFSAQRASVRTVRTIHRLRIHSQQHRWRLWTGQRRWANRWVPHRRRHCRRLAFAGVGDLGLGGFRYSLLHCARQWHERRRQLD